MKALLLLLAAVSSLCGQSAQITGFIKDSADALVPSAKLTLINQDTRAERKTTSNESGLYSIPALQPGPYDLTVEAAGFQTTTRAGIRLEVGQNARIDFSLVVGTTQQTITVRGDTPLINSTDGSVSTVINREFVDKLPLNGRSFQTLFQLTPGVVITPTSYTNPGQFSVNGQRANANYMVIDGVSANVGIGASNVAGPGAAGTQMGTSILGGTNNLVSVDALQEFRIQTSSFSPEFGRAAGGQISVVTRSGTNQFHGSSFDYFRNDILDANNWFANQKGQPRPPERQNDFGGIFGGPIIRDRTFFFFSYEGLRLRQPQTISGGSVPSLAARQSAPAPLQPYLNAFPLPNRRDLGNGFAEENATFSNPASLDSTSIRLDQRLRSGWLLFGRFNEAPSSLDQRAIGGNTVNTISRAAGKTRAVTIGSTWTVSPTLSDDVRFNFTTNQGSSGTSLDHFGGAVTLPISLECPTSALGVQDCGFSILLPQAYSSLSDHSRMSNQIRQINLTDSVVLTSHRHRFAVGGDVRWLRTVRDVSSSGVSTSFTGVGPASQSGTLLSGINSYEYLITQQSTSSIRYINLSLYMQDTWQISSRLNLTYGLRWELDPGPKGATLSSVTGFSNPAQLALGSPGGPLWATRRNNFAPRLGFAYSLRDASGYETVLRGGAGIFYDLVGGLISNQLAAGPNAATSFTFGGAFPDRNIILPKLPAAPPYSSAFYAVDPHLATPGTYEWNLALQQGLGIGRSVGLTYVGSKGTHLTRQEQLFHPNSTFSGVNLLYADGNSRYNAFQMQYQQRLSHGLQVLANYTLSHSIDDASIDSGTLPPSGRLSRALDKASSDFDVRHNGSAAVTYELPGPKSRVVSSILGRWTIDGMLVARSALPSNVTISRNLGYGTYVFRSDLLTGIPLYITDQSVGGGLRLNAAAFSVSSALRQGNLGRNALDGFGMSQINGALGKSFRPYRESDSRITRRGF